MPLLDDREWEIKSTDDHRSVWWNFEPWNTFNQIHKWRERAKKNHILEALFFDRKLIFSIRRCATMYNRILDDRKVLRTHWSYPAVHLTGRDLLMNYKYSEASSDGRFNFFYSSIQLHVVCVRGIKQNMLRQWIRTTTMIAVAVREC